MTNTETPSAHPTLPTPDPQPTTTTPQAVKAGARTSEFYLALAAKLLGGAYATGLIGDGTLAARIAGLAAVVLAYFGYTVSRTLVKTAGALVVMLAIGGATMTTGCAGSMDATTMEARRIGWDCTAPARAEAAAALIPLADSAILAAASADGKLIDDSKIKAALSKANLKSELGAALVCAAAEAFAALTHPPTQAPNAAQVMAAPLAIDPEAARATFDRLRAAQFPGVPITTTHGML